VWEQALQLELMALQLVMASWVQHRLALVVAGLRGLLAVA